MLEKVPKQIKPRTIKRKIMSIGGVEEIHHLRIWQLDENNIYAMMHIVVDEEHNQKEKVREILHSHGITNSTIEIETKTTLCNEKEHVENECHSHHHKH
jgi:cobalt-zinc-cadmium efflux system protein